MNNELKTKEFELLGVKIRFRPEDSENHLQADDIVEKVRKTALNIQETTPGIGNEHLGILLALHFAGEVEKLKGYTKLSLEELERKTEQALSLISE